MTTTHKGGLVVGMRSLPGNPDTAAAEGSVRRDLGYRGAIAPDGIKVYHRKLRRGITARLKRDIQRRSAIEPAIGYIKNDGRLLRAWLRGTEGDAFHAILCGCGHNLRMILRKLRLLLALILV